MAHKDISPPITICEKSNKTKVPQLRSNHPIVVLLNVFKNHHNSPCVPKFSPSFAQISSKSKSCHRWEFQLLHPRAAKYLSSQIPRNSSKDETSGTLR